MKRINQSPFAHARARKYLNRSVSSRDRAEWVADTVAACDAQEDLRYKALAVMQAEEQGLIALEHEDLRELPPRQLAREQHVVAQRIKKALIELGRVPLPLARLSVLKSIAISLRPFDAAPPRRCPGCGEWHYPKKGQKSCSTNCRTVRFRRTPGYKDWNKMHANWAYEYDRGRTKLEWPEWRAAQKAKAKKPVR